MYPTPDLRNKKRMQIDDIFGVVSDTHLGAFSEGLKELNSTYDYFAERGVKQVFHVGDVCDGEGVYVGQRRYTKCHGFQAQLLHAAAKYPQKPNMKTFMVAGNHDMSFLIRSGADIVKEISLRRPDLVYSGLFYARYQDGSLKLDALHPRGGSYYSKSYGIQKWIRNNEMPNTYPDIMLFGHWHHHGYFNDHGIECVMAGTFEKPTEYTIRLGYTGGIGGWVIEIPKRDKPIRLKLEWVSKE